MIARLLPVVTPEEMAAIDAAAPEPVEELIERAGAALAAEAVRMLGGTYGRRVVVVAGKGNNGADGRAAAARLSARGVSVLVLDAADGHGPLPPADLVVDAAYGTGFRGEYEAPDAGGAPVLAADIPSGVSGLTGEAGPAAVRAVATVTFAALKPGLVFEPGRSLAGDVAVADIGLDVSRATVHLVDDAAAAAALPRRRADAHKWRQAVLVVAGSPGMTGAASLAAEAAMRAGAGMVRLASPGGHAPDAPREVVTVEVDEARWAEVLLDDPGKVHAAAVGPGLGHSMATRHQVRSFVAGASLPVVVDGDGLTALGTDAAAVLSSRRAPTVLTPHDGELERLIGRPPSDDRIGDVRSLASASGAVVLRKGPTTVVAAPDGRVRLVRAGDQRLATAGTGDVLTGIVAALLAAGLDALDAAAVGAHVHGLAGRTGPRSGTVASDVVDGIPLALDHLLGGGPQD